LAFDLLFFAGLTAGDDSGLVTDGSLFANNVSDLFSESFLFSESTSDDDERFSYKY